MSAIEALVSRLSRTPTPANLFNPFNQICATHDLPDAPAIRRRNLARLLRAHQKLGTRMLWVFEAPSYLGARRSGAPFVNEGNFQEVEYLLRMRETFEKATRGAPKTALTTRLAWKLARELEAKPLIWEALPFHPHLPGQPFSNRRPTSREINAHKHFLLSLLEIFNPTHVLAVGRVAERALGISSVPASYVRHPAQGGATQFREQIRSLLTDR